MQYTELEPGYFVSSTQVKQLQTFGYIVYGKINHGALKDQKCVVKILFPPRDDRDEEEKISQTRELEVTQKMNHRNIIRTYKIIDKDSKKYLFKEYQDYKTMASIHQSLKGSSLGDNLTLDFAAQLIHCLAYLASQSILNRDISLHNLLLTNDLTPKIFDFGVSKIQEDFQIQQSTFVGGNDYFMSPQNLTMDENCDEIDFEKNDVWALGMTLFVLNEVEFPWFKKLRDDDTDAFEDELKNLRVRGIIFKRTKNPQLQDIIRRMLQYDQNSRPTFQELSQTPIIQSLLEKHLIKEQQLFQKGQLFNKFKEIIPKIKVSETIQEIIYNKLIRDFTIDRDYVNIGTELHGIYKELLEKQILMKKKLLTEFQLKQQIKEAFQIFLRRQIRNDPIDEQEYELFLIILQLQGIQTTKEEVINELKKQCKVV